MSQIPAPEEELVRLKSTLECIALERDWLIANCAAYRKALELFVEEARKWDHRTDPNPYDGCCAIEYYRNARRVLQSPDPGADLLAKHAAELEKALALAEIRRIEIATKAVFWANDRDELTAAKLADYRIAMIPTRQHSDESWRRKVALLEAELRVANLNKHYKSTACYHGKHEACRKVCKFCGKDCSCPCHT